MRSRRSKASTPSSETSAKKGRSRKKAGDSQDNTTNPDSDSDDIVSKRNIVISYKKSVLDIVKQKREEIANTSQEAVCTKPVESTAQNVHTEPTQTAANAQEPKTPELCTPVEVKSPVSNDPPTTIDDVEIADAEPTSKSSENTPNASVSQESSVPPTTVELNTPAIAVNKSATDTTPNSPVLAAAAVQQASLNTDPQTTSSEPLVPPPAPSTETSESSVVLPAVFTNPAGNSAAEKVQTSPAQPPGEVQTQNSTSSGLESSTNPTSPSSNSVPTAISAMTSNSPRSLSSVSSSAPSLLPGKDGVYLSGDRAMSLSPAFGSEQYDAMQGEQVLRSMNSARLPPGHPLTGALQGDTAQCTSTGGTVNSEAPGGDSNKSVSGTTQEKTPASTTPGLSKPQQMFMGAVPDLLSDSSVSLLSSVPAAMQQQQEQQQRYTLAMAMNASGTMSSSMTPGTTAEGGVTSQSKSQPSTQSSRPTPGTTAKQPTAKTATKTSTSSSTSGPAVAKKDAARSAVSKPATATGTSSSDAASSGKPSSTGAVNAPSKSTSPAAETSTATPSSTTKSSSSTPGPGSKTIGKSTSHISSTPVFTSSKSDGAAGGTAASKSKSQSKGGGGRSSAAKSSSTTGKTTASATEAASNAALYSAPSTVSTSSRPEKDDTTMKLLKRQEALKSDLLMRDRKNVLANTAPPFSAPRLKCQWDYLMEEVQWMAVDYRQERRWKRSQSKAVAEMCAEKAILRRRPADNEVITTGTTPLSYRYALWLSQLGRATRCNTEKWESSSRKRKRCPSPENGTMTEGNVDATQSKEALRNIAKSLSSALKNSLAKSIVNKNSSKFEKSAENSTVCGEQNPGNVSSKSAPSDAVDVAGNDGRVTLTISKSKKDPFSMSDEDMSILDHAITSKFGSVFDLLKAMESSESSRQTNYKADSPTLELNSDQKMVLRSVLNKSECDIASLVYGDDNIGKTVACAAVVSSWIRSQRCESASTCTRRPVMIITNKYQIFRWKYEIKKNLNDCVFYILDDAFTVAENGSVSWDQVVGSSAGDGEIPADTIASITNAEVVFCSSAEVLKLKSGDTNALSRAARWGGVMLDMRYLTGSVGTAKGKSGRYGPCWDIDGVIGNLSVASLPHTKPPKASSADGSASAVDVLMMDKRHAEKRVYGIYSTWLQVVTAFFAKSDVTRCCVSHNNFLEMALSGPPVVDISRSLLSSWLCFSMPSVFRDVYPEYAPLASERWMVWQSQKYSDKSFLNDDLIPLTLIRMPGFCSPRNSEVEGGPRPWRLDRVESCIMRVDMTPSHRQKYASMLEHLCKASALQGSYNRTSSKFEEFAKSLVILRRLCFHEDLVHASSPLDKSITGPKRPRSFVIHRPLPLGNVGVKRERSMSIALGSSCQDKTNESATPQGTTQSKGEKTTIVATAPSTTANSQPNTEEPAADTEAKPVPEAIPHVQFTSCHPHKSSSDCPKFDAVLSIIQNNPVGTKVAVVVDTYDEYILTIRFLERKSIAHYSVGLHDCPYNGENMLPNWYSAQRAITQFNDEDSFSHSSVNLIVLCRWVFGNEGIDSAHKLYSSYYSFQPIAAEVIVVLSSDWINESDFTGWFSRRPNFVRKVVRVVYTDTLEDSMMSRYAEGTTFHDKSQSTVACWDIEQYMNPSRLDDKIDDLDYELLRDDIRFRCPLVFVQGECMRDLGVTESTPSTWPFLESKFLQRAPVLSANMAIQKRVSRQHTATTKPTPLPENTPSTAPVASAATSSDAPVATTSTSNTPDALAAQVSTSTVAPVAPTCTSSSASTVISSDVSVATTSTSHTPNVLGAPTPTLSDAPVAPASVSTNAASSRPSTSSDTTIAPTSTSPDTVVPPLTSTATVVTSTDVTVAPATTPSDKDTTGTGCPVTTSGTSDTAPRVADNPTSIVPAAVPTQVNRTELVQIIRSGRDWLLALRQLTRVIEFEFSASSDSNPVRTNLHTIGNNGCEVAGRITIPPFLLARDDYRALKAASVSVKHKSTDSNSKSKGSDSKSSSSGTGKSRTQTEISFESDRLFRVLWALDESLSSATMQPRGCHMIVHLARTFVDLCLMEGSSCNIRQSASLSTYLVNIANEIVGVEATNSSGGAPTDMFSKRFKQDGFGVSSSEYIMQKIYEPFLHPRLSISPPNDGNTAQLRVDGANHFAAFKASISELRRRGRLADNYVFANPLQMATGRDVISSPSWLALDRQLAQVSVHVSFGESSMAGAVPGDAFLGLSKPNVKGRKSVKTDAKKKAGTTVAAENGPADSSATAAATKNPTSGAEPTSNTTAPTTAPTVSFSEAPKNRFPASRVRFNPAGTGWRHMTSGYRKIEDVTPPAMTVNTTLVSILPLGREGKKYRHVGEHRVGGYLPHSSSVSTNASTPVTTPVNHPSAQQSSRTCSDSWKLFSSKNFDLKVCGLLLDGDRKASKSGDGRAGEKWTDDENAAIIAATKLFFGNTSPVNTSSSDSLKEMTNSCEKKRPADASWVYERILDQCPPLMGCRSRSSRQALLRRNELLGEDIEKDDERGSLETTSTDTIGKKKRSFSAVSSSPSSLSNDEPPLKVRKDTVDVSLEAPYINNESLQVEHTTERVNTAERLKRALDSSQSQKELVMMGVTVRRTPYLPREPAHAVNDDRAEIRARLPIPCHESHNTTAFASYANAALNPLQIAEKLRQAEQAKTQTAEQPVLSADYSPSVPVNGGRSASNPSHSSSPHMADKAPQQLQQQLHQRPPRSYTNTSNQSSVFSGHSSSPLLLPTAARSSSAGPYIPDSGYAAPALSSLPPAAGERDTSGQLTGGYLNGTERPLETHFSRLSSPSLHGGRGVASPASTSHHMASPQGPRSLQSSPITRTQPQHGQQSGIQSQTGVQQQKQQQARSLALDNMQRSRSDSAPPVLDARPGVLPQHGSGSVLTSAPLLQNSDSTNSEQQQPAQSQFSHDSRSLARLRHIAESNPGLKAQVIEILTQQNISDHRKGELLRSLMERSQHNST